MQVQHQDPPFPSGRTPQPKWKPREKQRQHQVFACMQLACAIALDVMLVIHIEYSLHVAFIGGRQCNNIYTFIDSNIIILVPALSWRLILEFHRCFHT